MIQHATQFLECSLVHEQRFWVAVSLQYDDRVVAVCELGQWETATPFLSRVFVAEASRRMGAGRQIMQAAIAYCFDHGKKSISMWVHRDNAAALAFYAGLGFVHYFDHPDDDTKFLSRLL